MEFGFKESFLTGDQRIDLQHLHLFKVANQCALIRDPHFEFDKLVRAHRELNQFTEIHFIDEEKYMSELGYPQLRLHREVHNRLMDELLNLSVSLDSIDQACRVVQGFLFKFVHHILDQDAQIVRWRDQQGIRPADWTMTRLGPAYAGLNYELPKKQAD